MVEKITAPDISETILVNGVYVVERRSHKERRKNNIKNKHIRYERRRNRDPRSPLSKRIDESV